MEGVYRCSGFRGSREEHAANVGHRFIREGKIPQRREWQPTAVFSLSLLDRVSLGGLQPVGPGGEWDTTEQLTPGKAVELVYSCCAL